MIRPYTLAATIMLLIASIGAAQEPEETILRHESFLVFQGEAGRTISIEVESTFKGMVQHSDDVIVEVIDPASERALRAIVPLGGTDSISYDVAMDGKHAVRISTGWNVVTADIRGAPWALVAWTDVPINICGAVAPLYFKVPEGVREFAIELSASVAGEGAKLTVFDPNGEAVLTEAGDFVTHTRLPIEVPPGTDDAVWLLTITDPEIEGLYLDDVRFYLSGRVPPFFSPDPEHVEVFAADERYKPDVIDAVVPVITERIVLRADESETVTWQIEELPAGKQYALRVTAHDVDYPRELMLAINDGEPIAVPMTGNATTGTFTLHVERDVFRVGENTMKLTQDSGGGSLVVVANEVEILIGDRIKEYLGY